LSSCHHYFPRRETVFLRPPYPSVPSRFIARSHSKQETVVLKKRFYGFTAQKALGRRHATQGKLSVPLSVTVILETGDCLFSKEIFAVTITFMTKRNSIA